MAEAKCAVIEGWIAAGRMAPVEPKHLFFIIWAATQTYADFDCPGRSPARPAPAEIARF